MSRHLRQNSQNTVATTRFAAKENVAKTGVVRQALGEVTMAAVNRRVCSAALTSSLYFLVGLTRYSYRMQD